MRCASGSLSSLLIALGLTAACSGSSRPTDAGSERDATALDTAVEASIPDASADAMDDAGGDASLDAGAPAPIACGGPSDCEGGAPCVDGYCCASSCDGVCERCDLPGSEGSCAPAAAFTDPDNECLGFACAGYYTGFGAEDMCYERLAVDDETATCDGAGACASDSILCPVQSAGELQIDCDDACQRPLDGACRGANAGVCVDLDDLTDTISCGVGACVRTVPRCAGGAPASCTPGIPEGEICGNAVDEDCDGVLGGPGPILRLPFTVTNTSSSALNGGAVRFIIRGSAVIDAIRWNPDGVRVYTTLSPPSFASRGERFYLEDVNSSRVIMWVRVSLAAGASTQLYLFAGGPGPSASRPNSVFAFYDDFDGPSPLSDWTFASNSGASLQGQFESPRPVHSGGNALRDMLWVTSCEAAGRYAYSATAVWLPSDGLYKIALYGAAASCSTCTQNFIAALGSTVAIQEPGTGTASLRYVEANVAASAGSNQVLIGMFVGTGICSGAFEAFTDDILITPTVDPAPTVTLALDELTDLGCL